MEDPKESAAKKMIESAFPGDRYEQESPLLDVITSEKFRSLKKELHDTLTESNCTLTEFLCLIIELLMATTDYNTAEPSTLMLALRSTPITRQLMSEGKGPAEIIVVISSMLTALAISSKSRKNR